jgi:hypothetical protein
MIPYFLITGVSVENTKSLFENSRDWIPFYGALLITVTTALANFWRNKSKNKHDQFQILMDESAEFREEMRKERERLKKENLDLEGTIVVLKGKCLDYETQLGDCAARIKKAEEELTAITKKVTSTQQKLIQENNT